MPDSPVLYFRTSATKTTPIDSLPVSQKIILDGDTIQLQKIISGGTGNIVTEPEHSPSGEKTYHKQQVGGISENLRIIGDINITENTSIERLRSFFRMAQIDNIDFPFGNIGFFHDMIDFYSLDPDATQGYTMDPPEISFGDNVKSVKFDVFLSLGGKDLT